MKQLFFTAILTAFALAGCNNTGSASTSRNEADTVTRKVSSQIAYIHLDSLMANYDMYIDLMGAFEEKAKKAEADITSRGRSLERSAADAQNKFDKGLVTRAEAAQIQEDLQRREQSYYQFREQLQMELAEENQVMTNKIFYSIDDYIKEFNSDYRYGMILTTSGGTPILHADPALDITPLIIRGLNEKYARDKKQNSEN